MTSPPKVGIIMGSQSDWPVLSAAHTLLDELEVPHECKIVSAHRTPDRMYVYAREAEARGIQVIIAGAGGAAHLPGMVAALTHLPVFGVPMESKALKGMDSLLSIVQMMEIRSVVCFVGSVGQSVSLLSSINKTFEKTFTIQKCSVFTNVFF